MPNPLHIHFATTTGNAEGLANKAAERAKRDGFDVRLSNLADESPSDLTGDRLAIFIVSSYGDGDPPDAAEPFWIDLLKPSAPRLTNLRYALFGLGDRSHNDFNGFARKLDERLTALGATALAPRHEADTDYEDDWPGWEDATFALLANH
jgi:sulfite reductase alpha subunit-like flavoprotein